MSFNTGNNTIDSLVYSSWATSPGQAVSVTYSFMTGVPSDATLEDANGFRAMTAVHQQGARTAMATWASVANITFTETARGGDIQFGTNDQGGQSSGYAYLPDGINATYLFTNNRNDSNSDFTAGGFGLSVMIHEIGHTIGLKHPGDYDSTGGSVDGPFLPAATDNIDYTQMSYNQGAGFSWTGDYSSTPMMYDILAIQYLYGVNTSYHTGADTYSFSNATTPQCIWDAGGTDTLDFSACAGATVINLNAGTFSETALGYHNVSIAYGVNIERAIAGSGGSTIYANAAGNEIIGGAGNDLIYQGAGNDTISGGAGNDTVVFGKTSAAYFLAGSLDALTVTGDGADTLNGIETLRFSDLSIDLANYDGLQSGSAGNDLFANTGGNQLIFGGAGLDVFAIDGARASYQVTELGAAFAVRNLPGSTGDLLSGVERIQFSDGALALDTDGVAGQLYRLYSTLFDRTPDAEGMGYWLSAMDHGTSIATVATDFVKSDEFNRIYGGANSDQTFLTNLYQNALNRAPDAEGYAFWASALQQGVSRGTIMLDFTDSPEGILTIGQSMPVAIAYTPWLS